LRVAPFALRFFPPGRDKNPVPCWRAKRRRTAVILFRRHEVIVIITNQYLVGGLEHDFYDFPFIGNVIIPTD